MFGSTTPFGQPSSSPHGSQSMFGQTSSAITNLFAPKPFGNPNSFGAQTGGSMFGGTSMRVFGQPSTPTFGASSAPSFGSPGPALGASTSPAIGSSSSSFGGSLLGQKPTFGGFGSSSSQSSPFSSTFQQTQSAFGGNVFYSATPFGASSQPAFGATNTQAFGTISVPAFGATSSPALGTTSTPAFGVATTPAFGSTSTPLLRSTGKAFGVSSAPVFGSTVTAALGASFGSSSTPAFCVSTMAFGSSGVPAFGASSSPFSFGSTATFGQSTSAFGSTPGSIPSPFGARSSQQGVQAAIPPFGRSGSGQTALGGRVGGSRVARFTSTREAGGGTGRQPAAKLESISAMPEYKDKNHEELRWEDYQCGDKGGANLSGQAAGGIGSAAATQPSPFGAAGASGQTAATSFSSSTSSKPFAFQASTFGSTGFASTSTSLSNTPFSSSPSTFNTLLFGAPTGAAFGSSSSSPIFGGTTMPALSSSSSIFGSSMGTSSLSFAGSLTSGNSQPSALLESSTPSFGQTPSPPCQPSTAPQQSTPIFGSSIFSTPSTGLGVSLFSNSTSPSTFRSNSDAGFGQTTPSFSRSFPAQDPSQTSSGFSFENFGQTQPALSGGLGGVSNIFNQGTIGQPVGSQANIVVQPAPNTNPFGTLPVAPQMSIDHVRSASSVHFGISSMPVAEISLPVRTFSMSVPRHLSQRRIGLPPRRYYPKTDGRKVPFFAADEVSPTPRADGFVLPRENPRALIIHPIEKWASPNSQEGKISQEPSTLSVIESFAEEDDDSHFSAEQNCAPTPPLKQSQSPKANGGGHDNHTQKGSQDATLHEHGTDTATLMPKLQHYDYYTEPQLQELAAKERVNPGFCRNVKDFVVGRHGYGSIKFYGETDVRKLDLESIVQFNNREVIVYKDESRKPPVGQGLNKPAEITLLNVTCMNKTTGKQYTDGPQVDKYKEMLMKKAEEQGAEFVSYDAAKGEWKFRVKHFSI
ncbi:nuclear pore complex protein NUP98A-like isoform X2 [Typha angustifolia]|uniref:nuclear pore complex protein NUP98A-like isoform X2 n=1 Tax=Typha angustifolia TaxID=59011 RepID=UPI003C2E0268